MNVSGHRATVANWPSAKNARTSSIFRTFTPTGPDRAIGLLWQNPREKPYVLVFWPTLWPEGVWEPTPAPPTPSAKVAIGGVPKRHGRQAYSRHTTPLRPPQQLADRGLYPEKYSYFGDLQAPFGGEGSAT
jgi:hypothetical protein